MYIIVFFHRSRPKRQPQIESADNGEIKWTSFCDAANRPETTLVGILATRPWFIASYVQDVSSACHARMYCIVDVCVASVNIRNCGATMVICEYDLLWSCHQ